MWRAARGWLRAARELFFFCEKWSLEDEGAHELLGEYGGTKTVAGGSWVWVEAVLAGGGPVMWWAGVGHARFSIG